MSRTKWCAKPLCVVMALALVLGLSLMPAIPASAADLTDVSVTSDNYTAGATANYTIAFTTATTGNITTIDMVFATEFGVSGVTLGTVTEIGDGTISFPGDNVTYIVSSAENVTENTPVSIGLSGIVNPTASGSYSITITTKDHLDDVIDSGAASVTINPGDATKLGVTDITTPIIRGTASNVKVTAYDACENVATSYNGTIKFSSSDTEATLPSDYTFRLSDNGTHTFIDGVTFNTVGEQWVTATDTASSINGTQSDIYVYVIKVVTKKYYIETNLFGIEAWFHIGSNGEILKTIEATSQDGNLTITIPEGTIALNEDDDPLEELEAAVDKSPPDPPEDASIIGLVYDFGPDGATFDPPITLEVTYEPAEVPEGVAEEDLVVSWYDHETGKWEECEYTCDPETHCITACVCHFTCFAIIARAAPPPLAPAPVPAPAPPEVVAPAPLEPPAPSVAPEPPPEPPPEPEPPAKPAVNWPVIGGAIVAVVIVGVLIYFLVVRRRVD